MKALVYYGPRQMRWEDWPERPPQAGEVVVAVRAVGICGSDVHGYTGESGRRTPPMVMGHEAAGEIVALGPGVPEGWQGRGVVIQPFVSCGNCDQCRQGAINRCRNRHFFGASMDGAMAERITVPLANALPLPEGLDFAHGALTEPFAVALHAARQAGELTDQSVLIVGGGPIGLLTLVAVRRAGARYVAVAELVPRRRAAARELGADAAFDPTVDDWRGLLGGALGSPGGEVDVAFDAVGIPATFQQALEAVRPGGVVVALGGWRTVPLNLGPVVAREVRLRGSFNFTPAEFDLARRLLAERAFDPRCLVTDIHPLAVGAAVFAALAQDQAERIKVVLVSPEEKP